MTNRDQRIELAEDITALCVRLMGVSAAIGLVVGVIIGWVLF